VRRALDGGYELDDDKARIDVAAVFAYLHHESYWAAGRPLETVQAQLDAADRVVGLYTAGGEQVGYSRTALSTAGFAYLADVYVLAAHRGQGLGVELVRETVERGPFAHLRWALKTEDAHELYAKFGFEPPDEKFMERPPRPELRAGR
jgi:GNAT superfamily N-acetyltransferase